MMTAKQANILTKLNIAKKNIESAIDVFKMEIQDTNRLKELFSNADKALRKFESENNCHNISIYGISADAKDLLCRFIIENNLKFGVIEESTNDAPCKVEE